MPLTENAQTGLGNTVKIGEDEVVISGSFPSVNGNVLLVRFTKDSPGAGLVLLPILEGDLLDSEEVSHVSYPPSSSSAQINSASVALEGRVADLEAKLAAANERNREDQSTPAIDAPADAPAVSDPSAQEFQSPAIDPATGATAPTPDAPATDTPTTATPE